VLRHSNFRRPEIHHERGKKHTIDYRRH
jgi:hypothetical protein